MADLTRTDTAPLVDRLLDRVRRAARQEQVTGPGTSVLDASANWIEAWHYERVNLPREIPNQALEFDFVTKVGYGKNVLQRDQAILTALDRSKARASSARLE